MLHVQQTVALITPERIKRSLCRQQDFPRRSGEKLKLKLLFFPANIITNEQKYFPYKLQLNLLSLGRGVWENPRGQHGQHGGQWVELLQYWQLQLELEFLAEDIRAA